MSHSRPPRATLIDREANGGPGVLPARVRPATILKILRGLPGTRAARSAADCRKRAGDVCGLFRVIRINLDAAMPEKREATGGC